MEEGRIVAVGEKIVGGEEVPGHYVGWPSDDARVQK